MFTYGARWSTSIYENTYVKEGGSWKIASMHVYPRMKTDYAKGWARDAQPYTLESQLNSDSTGKDGKAAIWRTGFASPTNKATKPYAWSGTDAQDAPARGINPGSDGDYNPNNSNTQIFDPAFLKVDTDKVFETAQKHGGEKILTADANTPINYRLAWDRNTSKLVWHVTYGDGKLRLEVDATSGAFIRVLK